MKELFNDFIKQYDLSIKEIMGKYHHSFRVADIAKNIAISLNLNDEDIDLAYNCGLLHDIARFKQFTEYKTFIDDKSIDHGDVGYEILKELLDDNIKDKEIILLSTKYHNKYNIPLLDERTMLFCNIIRDADKLDIIKEQCNQMNDKEIILKKELLDKIYNKEICPNELINSNTDAILTGTGTSQCSPGYYKTAHNSYYNSSDSCTSCATGSYISGYGSTSCTACQNGSTTSGYGYSYCNTTCSNNSGVSYWGNAYWYDNYVSNGYYIVGCNTGYNLTGYNTCQIQVCEFTLTHGKWKATYECRGTTGTIQSCEYQSWPCSDTQMCTSDLVSRSQLNRYCPNLSSTGWTGSDTGGKFEYNEPCSC